MKFSYRKYAILYNLYNKNVTLTTNTGILFSFSKMQRMISLARTISTISTSLSARTLNVKYATSKTNLMQSMFSTFQYQVGREKLLAPSIPMVNSVCGFKIKGRVTRRCKDCYFVVRGGRMHVICDKHPRHKQKAMWKKPHNTWILTHASQSPVRPW